LKSKRQALSSLPLFWVQTAIEKESMKTITPLKLQKLIDERYVELIDIRPTKDFKNVHVLGARSIPFSEFEPHTVLFHRKSDKHAPLYIMGGERMLASLAACSLAGAGLADPIVVDGDIEEWERRCLPVVRKRSPRLPVINPATAVLVAGLAVALSLAFSGYFFLATLFVLGALGAPRALESASARFRDFPWAHLRVARSH
jgi:rhodanese-related sulfurtransferase